MTKVKTRVGINYPDPKGDDGAEIRVEAGEVVDLPPKIVKALGDAVEHVHAPKEDA